MQLRWLHDAAPAPGRCHCPRRTRLAMAFLLSGNELRLLSYMAGASDAQQRDLLWRALKNIADAMIACRQAALVAGVPVVMPEVCA